MALSVSQLSPARAHVPASPASKGTSSASSLSASTLPLSRPHLDRVHRRAMGSIRSLKRQLPAATSEKELAHVASLQNVVDQFHQALHTALNDRKQLHSDALELANAESMDLYNSVLAAERRATIAEQNLTETQAKLEEQRKLMSSKFANELSELKHGWSDQLAATAKQNEMRITLDKTRRVAEESAMRIRVMVDERSRMIADQTALQRQVENAAEKLRETVDHLTKEHGMALKEKDSTIAKLKEDVAKSRERASAAEAGQREAKRKQIEAERLAAELKGVERRLNECQSNLATTQEKLRQSKSAQESMEHKEAILRSDMDKLIEQARHEATETAKQSLSSGQKVVKQKVYEDMLKDREKMQNATKTLEEQVAKTRADLAAADAERTLLKTKFQDMEMARDHLTGVVEKLQKDLSEKRSELANAMQRAESLEERMRQELEKAAAIHSLNTAKAIAVTQKEAEESRAAAVAVVQKRADELSEKINEQRHEIDDKNRALATEQASVASLSAKLKDALSEVEENRRALLESLKLSSDVQTSESEIRSHLAHEREEHGRSKVELETLRAKLVHAQAEAVGARKECEELELGRVRTKEKREAAESRTRELESELGISRGRVLELEELRVQFEAEFRSLREELEKERRLVQTEKQTKHRLECDLEFAAEKRQLETTRQEMQLQHAKQLCTEAEAHKQSALNEIHDLKAVLRKHESLIEDMRVKITLLQTEKDSMSEELSTQREHYNTLIHRARGLERSESNTKNEIRQTEAELEKLRLKCARVDEQFTMQQKRMQDAVELAKKEKANTMKAEEALARITQENVLLRRRNMLMVNERDRVRRESEKLQSAARQAARKAQLAALHIQQMSVGENRRADDAFSAAEDLNWVAIGGEQRKAD